jgi:hypothetical protein
MSSKPHLEIYNFADPPPDETPSFTPFPRLPPEIREKIWRHAMQRERIIRVYLRPLDYGLKGDVALDRGPTGGAAQHIAIVDGKRLHSKCLHINSEARAAALRFYRVHVPCRLRRHDKNGFDVNGVGVLYFNPEFDFLYINAASPANDTILDFIYRLKTVHDPRRVGLCNLALDYKNYLAQLVMSELDPPRRDAFVDVISNLREVFFVQTPNDSRAVSRDAVRDDPSRTGMNRSMPILAAVPSFVRTPADPRAIDGDLAHLRIRLLEAFAPVRRWRYLLGRWGVVNDAGERLAGVERPRTVYRLLVACDPGRRDVADTHTAGEVLEREDAMWLEWLGFETKAQRRERKFGSGRVGGGGRQRWEHEGDRGPPQAVGAERERLRAEDLKVAVRPAFGFWTFPLEVFGELEGTSGLPAVESLPDGGWFLDWSMHWPELAVADLGPAPPHTRPTRRRRAVRPSFVLRQGSNS